MKKEKSRAQIKKKKGEESLEIEKKQKEVWNHKCGDITEGLKILLREGLNIYKKRRQKDRRRVEEEKQSNQEKVSYIKSIAENAKTYT